LKGWSKKNLEKRALCTIDGQRAVARRRRGAKSTQRKGGGNAKVKEKE